jgi:hypothetical protein
VPDLELSKDHFEEMPVELLEEPPPPCQKTFTPELSAKTEIKLESTISA